MMRRIFHASLFAVMLIFAPLHAFAEQDSWEARSDHYLVVSEISQAHADRTADHMEALLALFNRQFRFPVHELPAPLRVRVFASRTRYQDYLRRVIDESREGFVYLHYGDPQKSELVGFRGTGDDLTASFVHQGFVQFLRTFISNPPLWLREGFAVHFEATRYDPDFGTALFRENLVWLETLKALILEDETGDPIPLDRMLSLTLEEARRNVETFYPQAWGMVNFLINSPRPETNRILWDSISALSPSASLRENEEAVYNRAFRWVNQEAITQEFLEYVQERRTFRGWVDYGMEAFEENRLDDAERAFVQAGSIREDHHVPLYFLGLINYERGNYSLADYYYQRSLDHGADEPVTLYALGVNAYADNRFRDARNYLEMAAQADPGFRDRVESILVRIGS